MSVRIAALCPAWGRMDYLESCLRSVHPAVDRIVFGVRACDESEVRAVLDRIPELATRIDLVGGNWNRPETCVAELARMARSFGFPYALLVDPQDVYDDGGLDRILSFVREHPEVGQFQISVLAYWKSPRYRIDPQDAVTRTVVFKTVPAFHKLPALQIPADIGSCHNFTFASTIADVLFRLENSAAAAEMPVRSRETVVQWKVKVWDAWTSNPALRNLHPDSPERFRAAVRIHPGLLPGFLAHHPHLRQEVVGEVEARKSLCSVVLPVQNRDARHTQVLLRKLAETIPDDCEIVGCASDEDSLSVLASTTGVKAHQVPRGATLFDAWLAGSAVAESDNLVFLREDVEFAGDWIEGFVSAFEGAPPLTVFEARFHNTCDPLVFERFRGRFYRQQSPGDSEFDPGLALCWACSRETLEVLKPGSRKRTDTESRARPVVLDDTVLFHVTAPPLEPAEVAASFRATIVIPVFNNLHLTKDCLKSVIANTTIGDYEVVVVDNGSSDGTREFLQDIGSGNRHIRTIHNRHNAFFARGCNRGAWSARSPYIVFLNNDTIVRPRWLDGILRPLEEDETVGITGNKQLFPATHPSCANRVWHAGMVIGTDRLPWHICYGFPADHPAVSGERDCQSVSGCCLAIRRDLFEHLGGFDSNFQNGFEDVDLCLRAKDLGYRTVYTPHSEIVHLVSRSESRFDREASNLEKFKSRWSSRIRPDEESFLRDVGLSLTGASAVRVALISPFNQKGTLSRYAERLSAKYPAGNVVILSEFAAREPVLRPDSRHVIRCWDRNEDWCYPVLRWIETMDLNVIHINFDPDLYPSGFLELFSAIRKAGRKLVFSLHSIREEASLLAAVAPFADAVVVHTESLRSGLLKMGFSAPTVHVLSPLDADRHWMLYTALTAVATEPPIRVRWEGPQLVNHSLALVNREMERALLQRDDVELAIVPVGKDTFSSSLHSGMRLITSHYGRTLSGTADVHVRHQWPPNWNPPAAGRWVVIQPWEYGAVPQEWVDQINKGVDEVWAPSTFVQQLYIESGADPDRVHVVPNGVDTELFRPGVKPYALAGCRSFKFLFLGGTIHRKGIDALLEAYRRAFKSSDDVSLVIKDMGVSDIYRGQGMGERIREMQSASDSPHVVYLDRDLTDNELVQLYNACDCLVHPYRGEGFALPVLEAMACARPVIVTAGGATDDFVDDTTGFRIPARRVVFGNRSIGGLKTSGDLWLLEPDIDVLSETMLQVFHNPARAKETGMRARLHVEKAWTWENAAAKATRRLRRLKTLPVLRQTPKVDVAVLIDIEDEAALVPLVESMERTGYASLKVFVRGCDSPAVEKLRNTGREISVMGTGDFGDALRSISSRIMAPFLLVLTQPLRFSKQWPKQLADTARTVGPGLRIVAPRVDTSEYADEEEFQKSARMRWREHRGSYRQVDALPVGCALLNWGCLGESAEASIKSSRDWFAWLLGRNARIFVAEDTWFGSLSGRELTESPGREGPDSPCCEAYPESKGSPKAPVEAHT